MRKLADVDTTTQKERFWAVGFKGWVELRSHPTAPKAIRSVMEMEVDAPYNLTWNSVTAMYEHSKPTKRKREVKTVAYDGGRVLRVMTPNKFYRLTGQMVPANAMVEVTAEGAAKVKASKGYGYDRQ